MTLQERKAIDAEFEKFQYEQMQRYMNRERGRSTLTFANGFVIGLCLGLTCGAMFMDVIWTYTLKPQQAEKVEHGDTRSTERPR